MVGNSNYDKLEYWVENSKSKTINTALNNRQKLMLRLLFFIAFAFVLLVMPSYVLGAKTKNILILNSYHKGFEWTDAQVSAAKQVLLEKFRDIELYVEYMDTKRIYTAEYIERLMQIFKLKYKKVKFDVIITTDDNALKFVVKYHEEIFAKAPVSFCGINDYQEAMFKGRNEFTGLVEVLDIKPTIDLALKLHPNTRKVVVVVDNTPTGIGQRRDVAAVARQYENLRFEFLKGEDLSNEELFEKLQNLPRDSIVLLTVWLRDKNNDYLPTNEGGPLISSNATSPVYGIIDMYMGHGIIGGKLLNSRTHGKTAAEIALRILDGERPSDIPVIIKSTNPYMFDYQQLDRWGISLSALPEGSIVINKPFSIYDEYKRYIWSVVAIFILLVVFVAFLTANIQHRKRVEEALRESEEQYRSLLQNIQAAVVVHGPDTKIIKCNKLSQELLGLTEDQLLGKKAIDPSWKFFNEDGSDMPLESYPVNQVIATKNVLKDVIVGVYRPNTHDIVNVIVNAVPEFDHDGNISQTIVTFMDITELKRAEEALHESEERFRTLAEVSPVGIFRTDGEGNCLYVNERWCEIAGLTPEEAFGEGWKQGLHPDDRDRIFDEWYQAAKQNLPFKSEYRFHNSKGLTTWVIGQAMEEREPSGEIKGYIGTITNISERKQAEEEKNHYLSQLQATLDSTADGILVVDSHGKITTFNKRFIKLWNIPDAVIKSKDDDQTLAHVLNQLDDPNTFINKVKELYADPEAKSFDTIRFKDKRIFERYSGPQKLDGQIIGRVWSFRNVTDRYRMEKALRESEEKYRTILESIEEGYYEVDLTGNFTFLNDAMCKIRGQSRDELIGKNNKDYMNPDTAKTVYKYFNKVYDTGTPAKNVEWKTLRADGSERYVESSIDLIKNSKDQPIGFRGVVRDVTERKRMEDELRQARKMESIGTMAGGIAHDFNNLLYMITGNTELALEDTPEWNPVHANLQEIKSAGLRAAGIVKQLLNFSRKADQELKPIGVITVIKDALKFMRSMIPKTIEIRKHLPDTDVTILADPIQINQVLMNICTNASQAMEETGGILEITVENATLSEEAVANYPDLTAGEHIKITVSDTGPGIDPEIIDRIFDPYFTTKGFGEGSGMGLTVVHGIMKNHSGAIAVDSKPDKGATFTILFPVVAEKPVMEIKTPDATPRGNETILFVDDEESIATMAGQVLIRLGYKVETETNPEAALELFRMNPDRFDLVITDMTMPQMTGVKLSEKLKDVRPDIPVIICTGHSSLIDEEKAKAMGIDDYAMKPIVKRDIAKIIRKVLDKGQEK